MKNKFKIHLNLLKNSQIIKLNEKILFEEFEIEKEKEIIFKNPIEVQGEIYIANATLIFHLNIRFEIKLPCIICNEFIQKNILINNLYITKDLSEIKNIFDYKDEIRNVCFLEIPSFIECNDKCFKRQSLIKYLNNEKERFPFSNL